MKLLNDDSDVGSSDSDGEALKKGDTDTSEEGVAESEDVGKKKTSKKRTVKSKVRSIAAESSEDEEVDNPKKVTESEEERPKKPSKSTKANQRKNIAVESSSDEGVMDPTQPSEKSIIAPNSSDDEETKSAQEKSKKALLDSDS